MAVYKCKCGRLFNDCGGKSEIEGRCPVCGTPKEDFQKKPEQALHGRGADYFRCNAIKIVRQCKSAGVPVFVKQVAVAGKTAEQHRLSRKMAEWPEELRVQEMPNGRD